MTDRDASEKPGAGLKSRTPLAAGAVVFVLVLAISVIATISRGRLMLKESRTIVQQKLSIIGLSLTNAVNRRESLLTGLAAITALHPDQNSLHHEFTTYAEAMHANDPVVRALQVFPPLGPELVCPAQGNEAVMSRSFKTLLADDRPEVKEDLARTLESKKPYLSDPYELRQGGRGAVFRLAIYRNGGLWGMAVVVLDLDGLLSIPGLGMGFPDLRFSISDSKGRVFAGEAAVSSGDPVLYRIALPGKTWILSGAPVEGWLRPIRSRLVLYSLSGFLVSAILGFAAYRVFMRQSALSRKVVAQGRELEENRERLGLAIAASNIGFYDYDIATGLVLRSPEYERQLGYEPGEMPPENTFWDQSIHPEDKDATLKASAECVEGRKDKYEIEYRLRHRDGSWRWILGRGKTLIGPDGAALRLLGCHVDITRIKSVEEALRRSEERYKVIVHNLPLGIIHIMDRDFRFVFDSGEETRVGKSIYDTLDPGTADFVAGQYRRVLAGESVRYESGYKGETFLIQAAPLYGPDGIVEQVLALSINITERKVAEQKLVEAHAELRRLLEEADRSRLVLLSLIEDQKAAEREIKKLNAGLEERVRDRTAQLEAANKELEAFSYSVSHDLRSPLRIMNGFASALARAYSSVLDEQGKHYLDRIMDSTQRMGQLINDLLGLSRVTRVTLTRASVDLSSLARKIAGDLRAEHPERNVHFDIASGLMAEGDPQLLEIMMENLLGNAWKYSGKQEGAVIEVGLARAPTGLEPAFDHAGQQRGGVTTGLPHETVFFVRDNGVGFDMAYADRLFTPFQRLHGTAEFPGTGIGLVTVHRIVTRHGGRIWPEAAPGAGATFYFTVGG